MKISIPELMDKVYADADKILDEVRVRQPVTCKKGCDHCCYLLAIITLADGVYLAEELMRRPDWKEWAVKLKEASEAFLVPNITKEMWFEKKIPCVFLKDHSCQVYSKRPAACRFHLVISPPENCSPDAPRDVETGIVDLIELEAKTSWDISMKMHPVPLAAPIPLMTLFCMVLLAREQGKRDRYDELKKLVSTLPDPEAWIRKYGGELVSWGEAKARERGL